VKNTMIIAFRSKIASKRQNPNWAWRWKTNIY